MGSPTPEGQAVHPPVLPSGDPASPHHPCGLNWWDPLCCLCPNPPDPQGPRDSRRGRGFCSLHHSGRGYVRSRCPAVPGCEMGPLVGAAPEDPEDPDLGCGRPHRAGSRSGCRTGLWVVGLHHRGSWPGPHQDKLARLPRKPLLAASVLASFACGSVWGPWNRSRS